jgi:hypothetical protein
MPLFARGQAVGTIDAPSSVERSSVMSRTFSDGGPIPTPPRLRPTWTTWMWTAFAILAVVLTVLGLMVTGGIPWR